MKPVKFNFDSNNPNESLDNFKELLKCMQNPRFDSAYIKYESNVGADNPKFPLVLLSNSDKYEIHVGGGTIGPRRNISKEHINPYLSSATIEILRIAGFKVGESIQNMILMEPKLHVTIWNNIE